MTLTSCQKQEDRGETPARRRHTGAIRTDRLYRRGYNSRIWVTDRVI